MAAPKKVDYEAIEPGWRAGIKSPEQLAAVGRDTECLALARAIQWHAEHRVLLNGKRTVVFR